MKLGTLLPILYAMPTSVIFLHAIIIDIRLNALTITLYLANIIVTLILYKVGEKIDIWLKH